MVGADESAVGTGAEVTPLCEGELVSCVHVMRVVGGGPGDGER